MKQIPYTKAVFTAIVLLLVVTLQTRTNVQGAPAPSANSKSTMLPANATAQMVAKYTWDKLLTHCGDSWLYGGSELRLMGKNTKDYLDGIHEDNLMRDIKAGLHPDKVTWEFKGVTFELREYELSQADRLNGIEWQGWAGFSPTSWRMRPKSWQSWSKIRPDDEAFAYAFIKKIKGHWYYNGSSDVTDDPASRGISPNEFTSYEKPSCSISQ